MRYLGQLGVAVKAASRAAASAQAPVGEPDEWIPGQPGLPAERAAAWRAWAEAWTETATARPRRAAGRGGGRAAARPGSRDEPPFRDGRPLGQFITAAKTRQASTSRPPAAMAMRVMYTWCTRWPSWISG